MMEMTRPENNVNRVSFIFLLAVCLAGFLSGCGGGGGDAVPSPLSLALDQAFLPEGTVGIPYNQSVTMTAAAGKSPYVYSCTVSNPDSGLSATVSSSAATTGGVSCIISGTPLNAGGITVHFSVADTTASASAVSLSISIGAPVDPLDNWHLRYSIPQGDSLYGVAYANGKFVAVGKAGTVLTSIDGIFWTSRTSGTAASLSGVTYGNGTFVAVGGTDYNQGTILTSSDGSTWTSRTLAADFLSGVTYGNGTFVAVGVGPSILTSSDGITWTPRNPATTSYRYSYSGLGGCAFGNGTFVVTGSGGFLGALPDSNGLIQKSVDGITWTLVQEKPHTAFSGVTYGNGIFVAVGNIHGDEFTLSDTDKIVLTSTDGSTWTTMTLPPYSPNGYGYLFGVTFGHDTFVAVGDKGAVFTSLDGETWTPRVSGTANSLNGVTYGSGTFVGVGNEGTIIQSDPISE